MIGIPLKPLGTLRSTRWCENSKLIYGEDPMEKWEQDLDKLLDSGAFGFYKYCQVDQIVLIETEAKTVWNYFTHVHFSKRYTEEKKSTLLEKPVSVRKGLKLVISQYIMSTERFRECVWDAVNSKIWSYTDSEIDEGDKIDDPFPTPIKYVAENDPTGSLYGQTIPLEESLYGSNFEGNYYIFEVYAKAEHIKEVLSEKERQKIQDEITKCKLNYRLERLEDRIGNVVCKFENEVLNVKPISFGHRGIEHEFKLAEGVKSKRKLHFHVEQEHDKLLYECRDKNIVLKPGASFTAKEAQPSQCKTTITATDRKTGLVLFRYISDQSVYSSYRGQISLPKTWVTLSHEERKIKRNGKEISIPFNNVQQVGTFEAFTEMLEAGKRQQRWEDVFFQEQKYLNFYNPKEEKEKKIEGHKEALSDIKSIINNQLLWDLQEVCMIDPYLSASDILDTVAFCEKKNIQIRCLTDLHTINKNEEARKEILPDDNSGNPPQEATPEDTTNETKFETAKKQFRKELEEALGADCDLNLTFRTVYANCGSKFHDRYLILRYHFNKTRVWSLGASVNSLGKSHHIIQIVESPTLIEDFFDKVWSETTVDECKIYDSSDYKPKEE